MRRKSYTKINKWQAKKRLAAGKEIIMIPCNQNPYFWDGANCCTVTPDKLDRFEKIHNEMLYYNCTNSETGRRVAYYCED